jgi:hypothetical protein
LEEQPVASKRMPAKMIDACIRVVPFILSPCCFVSTC